MKELTDLRLLPTVGAPVPGGRLSAEPGEGARQRRRAAAFADMTTSPDDEPVGPDDRLAEIQARYGPGDVVTRSIDRARPDILAAVARARERLAAADAQAM